MDSGLRGEEREEISSWELGKVWECIPLNEWIFFVIGGEGCFLRGGKSGDWTRI